MKFVIDGGKKLEGEIEVCGAKNAVLPIIAATLLTDEQCVIDRVPRITDVDTMIRILESIGGGFAWTGDHELTISTRGADLSGADVKLVKNLRASILFLGAFLARFQRFEMPAPGGCIIGNRPLDTHFAALQKLGVSIEKTNGSYLVSHAGLHGADITLLEASVTATENLLLASVKARGTTTIRNAACEPHVQDLVHVLQAMGARIKGAGTHTLVVEGVDHMHGVRHTVIPDPIEAGTFLILGIATKSRIKISNIRPHDLDVVTEKLRSMGAQFDVLADSILVTSQGVLRAANIDARPYPGIPTDLQSPFGVLATQLQGTSLIHDTLFEGRLGYIQELVRMGANAVVCDPHRVLITGPTPLYGQEIKSFDLRAGVAMIVAGLLATGQTMIHDGELVDRGYEGIVSRLTRLGAAIEQKA